MEGAAAPISSTSPAARVTASGTSITTSSSVIQRLAKGGVPVDYLGKGPAGFVEFVHEDRTRIPLLLGALFPDVDEVKEAQPLEDEFLSLVKDSVFLVQWILFEGDPSTCLTERGLISFGQKGICGAVWGGNDIAYRCRTCEHDPTCAICVPCFRAGDHRNHDYSMIRTGGGCCDCGDTTAWKQTGFCSQHRGLGHVPSLPAKFVNSASPILEALFLIWVSKLNAAHVVSDGKPKIWTLQTPEEKVASQTSIAIILMLLDLCNLSESMLNFTAKHASMKNVAILDTLLRTEALLPPADVEKLHELLYKLLGSTTFKCSFAKGFILHYPKFLRDSVREDLEGSSSFSITKHREHAILSNFSVQIFTVPTITPKLVRESKLLDMLLETLKELLLACVGEDGRLLVSKGPIVHRLYSRVLEDIRYVMSHAEVAQHVAQQRPELARAWLELVAFVQGIYPQRRVFNLHVEEETEDCDSAYYLEVQMASIHALYVIGAAARGGVNAGDAKSSHNPPTLVFGPDGDTEVFRHAKLGRITKQADGMDVAHSSIADVEMDDVTNASCACGEECQTMDYYGGGRSREGKEALLSRGSVVPGSLVWLVSECVSILDRWLALDVSRELARGLCQSDSDCSSVSAQRRGIWRGRARGLTGGARSTALILEPAGALPIPAPGAEGGPGRGATIREWLRRTRRPLVVEPTVQFELVSGGSASSTASPEMDVDATTVPAPLRTWESVEREWWMGSDFQPQKFGAGVGHLLAGDWWTMDFDVSRQDVSFHLPLHRMLALLLNKALESHCTIQELAFNNERNYNGSPDKFTSFTSLHQLLPEQYQVPAFAALMMEHPLRLQVLCAQVQAGMWRRNGQTTSTLCNLYRTVPWCEDSLELDLLMLQCCSVLAPPGKFVEQIQTRFGLKEYFTLCLKCSTEYEPSLAQEFLILLIRLCAERGFCGLSPLESLRRELVQRLAVGDATHSSLVKALPRRLQDSKDLEECLKSVALYQNPSGMQQGKYALREECWCELDLYHPRWSPREIQLAEDRYHRICKVSPVYMQLPRWKMPFSPLQTVGHFIISATVHDILRCIFFHAAFSDKLPDSRAPEGLLFAALHLLALALDLCHITGPRKVGCDGSEDVGKSDWDATQSRVPDTDHPTGSGVGLLNPSSLGGQDLPLLVKSVEKVNVYSAEDAEMPDRQSLLSLLVMLLRKYGSCSSLPGTLAETIEYSTGDVIKSLLRKFADLHRGCMYEIESLAPEILHRATFALPSSTRSCRSDSDEKKAVSDAERRKAMAREHQQSAMAKMKAAQDRFVATLVDENIQIEKDKLESKRSGEALFVGQCLNQESSGTSCALCRDSASASPLCVLTLVQKSRIVALALKPTPSWEKPSSNVGVLSSERRKESSVSLVDGNNEMYTTVDLWNWIQDALADATTRERLLGGEALLEVFRNGLRPGIRNAIRLANAVGMPPVRMSEPAESEADEGECSGESNELESLQVVPVYSARWWEQDPVLTAAKEGIGREIALATVLAEYVTAVSKNRRRQGVTELPRTGDIEGGSEGGSVVRGRRLPGRDIMDTTVNTGIGICDTAGVVLSACGHAVHQDCLDRYFSTLLQRYDSRALFEGVQIVDPDMGEFLCPVCRRLANSIVPVFPESLGPSLQSNSLSSADTSMEVPPIEVSGPSEMERCSSRTSKLQQAFQLLSNAENLANRATFRTVVCQQLPDSIKGALETLAVRLHGLYNPDREHLGGSHGRVPQSLHLWDVFRYSLMSAELAARTQQASSCMQGSLQRLLTLDEAVDARKGSVLPLLLHATQAIQGQSRQVVLLRARGMQLLVDSIMHGVPRDLFSLKSVQGDFSPLRQYLAKAEDSPDVQFWKRMADPVLLHDPFSSLVWLIFSLPLPLPSEQGPFTALVHIFYLVCLTQVIAYAGTALASDTKVGLSAVKFGRAVQEALSGSIMTPSLGNENFGIPTGPALILFRRLTLPFLRQCFLLQKLMSGSGQLLPVASAHLWELSQRHGSISTQYSARNSSPCNQNVIRNEEQQVHVELEELDQLESLFSIPSLISLMEDGHVQAILLKWCEHVRADAVNRIIRHVPRPVIAAPFKLMQLPHLYQDLMQRYVKECCPQCKNVPDKPALCLLCGTVCCAVHSARPCCSLNRQGECYRHAMACGAGVGVFLMLRKTNILLQRCERRALWPSPYLDAFGEEDGEQRGKPLFLSVERYSALTAMIASHGLDYSSLVLAQTTRQIL